MVYGGSLSCSNSGILWCMYRQRAATWFFTAVISLLIGTVLALISQSVHRTYFTRSPDNCTEHSKYRLDSNMFACDAVGLGGWPFTSIVYFSDGTSKLTDAVFTPGFSLEGGSEESQGKQIIYNAILLSVPCFIGMSIILVLKQRK